MAPDGARWTTWEGLAEQMTVQGGVAGHSERVTVRKRQQLALRRFENTPVVAVTHRRSLGPPPPIDWGGYPWAPSRESISINLLGLRTPDLPAWITPEQAVAAVREWARAEHDRVGDEVKARIRQALADTGVGQAERWMYCMIGHLQHGGLSLLKVMAYQPIVKWPLLHDELGNVVARELLIKLPEGSRYGAGDYGDYAFDVFGVVLRSRAAFERLPERVALGIYEEDGSGPDGQPFNLAAYRVRAFHAESPVVGIASWHPGQDAISTGTYGGILGHDESHIAQRGLDLFYEIQHRRAGMSDEDAFEEAVRLGIEWLQDNPWATPADFGRTQLTVKRITGPDATKKWLKEKHFGIKDVQRALTHRFQRTA
jgi:hypothetical protein